MNDHKNQGVYWDYVTFYSIICSRSSFILLQFISISIMFQRSRRKGIKKVIDNPNREQKIILTINLP